MQNSLMNPKKCEVKLLAAVPIFDEKNVGELMTPVGT